jgi:hypothetical protein
MNLRNLFYVIDKDQAIADKDKLLADQMAEIERLRQALKE